LTTSRGIPHLAKIGTLDALFHPRGIVYLGVPRRGRSLGGLAMVFGMARPGRATMHVVHPELSEVHGVQASSSLASIEGPLDVAFVAVPAAAVEQVVQDCADRGVGYAIIGSSGFAEAGTDGAALQERLTRLARTTGVRLIGPNCNGLWNVRDGLSVGFNTAHGMPLRPGPIGVVGQTGAVLGSFLAGVDRMGGGLSYAISTGNEADVDAAECFAYLSDAAGCEVIVLLLDSITRPDVFQVAARRSRERGIPVIAYKFGKSSRGRHAAELHSSRVAGGARAFSAWLRSLGIAEAGDLESAMFAAALLGSGSSPAPGLGAVSTSGAGAAMVADLAEHWAVALPEFGEKSRARLSEVTEYSAPFNPLDLAGQATDRGWLASTMDVVFEEPAFGTVVLLSTLLPPKDTSVAPVVSEFVAAAGRHAKASCVYAVGPLEQEYRDELAEAGIPVADTGTTLFGGIHTAQRVSDLAAAPWSVRRPVGPGGADVTWPTAVDEGGLVLHDECRTELRRLGVPFVAERSSRTPEEAGTGFTELGGAPVAMKLLDRAVPHKASAGGVVLGVASSEDAVRTAGSLLRGAASPDARILLQPMTAHLSEIFVGTVRDTVAGPVVVVGRGGSDVEREPDVVVELAPVDHQRAVSMVTGIRSVMEGISAAASRGGRPVSDCVSEVAQVVVTVSEVAYVHRGRIVSIDLNPLVITDAGTLAALDVRVQLAPGQDEASSTPNERRHTP